MAQNHKESSQYFDTPLVDNAYLDIARIRPLISDVTDQEYTVPPKFANRPDLLAYDLYGSPKLWWVFAQRNMDTIKDPIYDLKVGTKIYLPKASDIKSRLGV